MTFIILFNLFYDFWKIFKKKNITWHESYNQYKIYGYGDFINEFYSKIKSNEIKLKNIFIFLLFLKIIKIIIKIQILIFLFYFLYYKIKKKNIYTEITIKRSLIRDLIINNPKIYAFEVVDFFKIQLLFNVNIFKNILISFNNIILWNNLRITIHYSIICTNYVDNWLIKNPRKKNLKEFKKLLESLIRNNFIDKVKYY
jgi:hypothetical protein